MQREVAFLWIAAVPHVTTFSTFKFTMHVSELESTYITRNDYRWISKQWIMLNRRGNIRINVGNTSAYSFETHMNIIINLSSDYKMIGLLLYQDLDFE